MMPSEDGYADGERDALALLAALVAGDDEGGQLVEKNMFAPAVMTALVNLLFGVLGEHGIDRAGWVAQKQAELRARLGGYVPGQPDGPPAPG